jgi:hypothetical protein
MSLNVRNTSIFAFWCLYTVLLRQRFQVFGGVGDVGEGPRCLLQGESRRERRPRAAMAARPVWAAWQPQSTD